MATLTDSSKSYKKEEIKVIDNVIDRTVIFEGKSGNKLVEEVHKDGTILEKIIGVNGEVCLKKVVGNVNEDFYDYKKVEEIKSYVDFPQLYNL